MDPYNYLMVVEGAYPSNEVELGQMRLVCEVGKRRTMGLPI